MSNLLTLLLMEVLILVLVMLTTEYDVISPSFIFCASWLICTIAAIIRSSAWSFCMSNKALVVILSGILSFVVAGAVIKPLLHVRRASLIGELHERRQGAPIELPAWILIATIMLNVVISVWVFTIVGEGYVPSLGASGLVNQFKQMRLQNIVEGTFVVNQMLKISKALVYIETYVVIHNAVCSTKSKKVTALPLLAIITWIVSFTLMSASRQQVVEFLLGVFILIIVNMRKIGQAKNANALFMRFMCACILVLPVFFFWGLLVGRNIQGRFTPIEYIAGYLGGGFCHLDHLVTSNIPWSGGTSSFSGIIAFLQDKFDIFTNVPDMSYHSAIVLADSLYVTTVTTFGRWYEDFGIPGVIIMSSLVSLFYHGVYYGTVKWPKSRTSVRFSELLYTQILATLFFAGYDDHVTFWLSPGRIITVIIMYVLFRMLVRKGIRQESYET